MTIFPLKPPGYDRRDGNDHGFSSKTEDQTSGSHEKDVASNGREKSTQEDQKGKDQRSLLCTNLINDYASNQHHEYVRYAIDPLQQPDVLISEMQLAFQHIGERADAVIDVVIAKHGKADEDEHDPAKQRRRFFL